jgi:DNA-binding beta-propeller fold protein YncE
MLGSKMRLAVAVAAVVALGALGVTEASSSDVAAQARRPVRVPTVATSHVAAAPGAVLWAKRYYGRPGGGTSDTAASVALSPDGATVFVTGQSAGASYAPDYATLAYNAATGARLWVKRYNGPGNHEDRAVSVAVSPDGSKVFVTGSSTGTTSYMDYATLAYSAATGAQLWVKRYNGPGNGTDNAESMAVSPDGQTVFVTGASWGADSRWEYATLAYSAATGARLWVKRYIGPGNPASNDASAISVAVSPNAAKVFVTGVSVGATSLNDYTTVAYNAATGAQLWVSRYNGPLGSHDHAHDVAVSPDGTKVFVTGDSEGVHAGYYNSDYATVAYSAATGAQLWAKRYNGTGYDKAYRLAVSPDGAKVFVTGESDGAGSTSAYATIAYSTATGTRLWVRRYSPDNGRYTPFAVAVSPDGQKVFVTGPATLAYSAATGAQLWASRYTNGGGVSMAVSPDGGTVFTAGSYTAVPGVSTSYLTIAYSV